MSFCFSMVMNHDISYGTRFAGCKQKNETWSCKLRKRNLDDNILRSPLSLEGHNQFPLQLSQICLLHVFWYRLWLCARHILFVFQTCSSIWIKETSRRYRGNACPKDSLATNIQHKEVNSSFILKRLKLITDQDKLVSDITNCSTIKGNKIKSTSWPDSILPTGFW